MLTLLYCSLFSIQNIGSLGSMMLLDLGQIGVDWIVDDIRSLIISFTTYLFIITKLIYYLNPSINIQLVY